MRNATCTHRTFAEPLLELAPAFARRTDRLTTILQAIEHAGGGEAGRRLAADLRVETSADTLLRIVRCTPLPEAPIPRVLGLDDWAQAKRRVYETILVDLERHRAIDLLADRTAETLSAWLQAHPGIEIITRDRSGQYARGIVEGAPAAKQVADRWHLLRNLREALERLRNRYHAQLSRLPAAGSREKHSPPALVQRPRHLRALSESERLRQQASRARRQRRYEAVQALAEEGISERQIAHRLGIARATMRTFCRQGPSRNGHSARRCPASSTASFPICRSAGRRAAPMPVRSGESSAKAAIEGRAGKWPAGHSTGARLVHRRPRGSMYMLMAERRDPRQTPTRRPRCPVCQLQESCRGCCFVHRAN